MRKRSIGPAAAGLACAVLSLAGGAAKAAPREIALSGVIPDLQTVEVDSSHVYDYTFTTAPTDWWVQSGVWEMTNRWSCSPGWSWFGGRSEEIASVWNKRHFSGDMSVQYYFAFKMGVSGKHSWPEYCSDAAVNLYGDGKSLGTGYSFIVDADDNQHSILMRNGKLVAESSAPEALLPSFANGQVGIDDIHRRWWYVRVNKVGSQVECYLDNKLVLTYNDPQPLNEGQVALWTYDNGIMLSRVQLYFEDEATPQYVRAPAATGSPSLKRPSANNGIKIAAR